MIYHCFIYLSLVLKYLKVGIVIVIVICAQLDVDYIILNTAKRHV